MILVESACPVQNRLKEPLMDVVTASVVSIFRDKKRLVYLVISMKAVSLKM